MKIRPGFTRGNTYLFDRGALTWNLPSGYTCPGALECLALVDRRSGKLSHGDEQRFLCYSAVTERFPAVREKAWANYEAVRGKDPVGVAEVLTSLLPRRPARNCRIHAGGDFFSQAYFDGWLVFCGTHPDVRFWAFTKSVPLWVRRLGEVPPNLTLTASRGGKWDRLIDEYGLKSATVVSSPEEAAFLGLPIDTDDALAAEGPESFALLDNFAGRRRRAA